MAAPRVSERAARTVFYNLSSDVGALEDLYAAFSRCQRPPAKGGFSARDFEEVAALCAAWPDPPACLFEQALAVRRASGIPRLPAPELLPNLLHVDFLLVCQARGRDPGEVYAEHVAGLSRGA